MTEAKECAGRGSTLFVIGREGWRKRRKVFLFRFVLTFGG